MKETIEEKTEIIIEEKTEVIIEPKQPKITASRASRASRASGEPESDENAYIWHLVFLRNTRNSYLNLTDKYILPDYPITDEKKEIILNYRQMLRHIININEEAILNGANIEIPPIPI